LYPSYVFNHAKKPVFTETHAFFLPVSHRYGLVSTRVAPMRVSQLVFELVDTSLRFAILIVIKYDNDIQIKNNGILIKPIAKTLKGSALAVKMNTQNLKIKSSS
jgi:hypothetical protein